MLFTCPLPPSPFPALSAFARGTPIRSSRSRTVHNRALERPRSLNAPVQHRREPTHRLRTRRIVEQAHCKSISFLYYPSFIPPPPPKLTLQTERKYLPVHPVSSEMVLYDKIGGTLLLRSSGAHRFGGPKMGSAKMRD